MALARVITDRLLASPNRNEFLGYLNPNGDRPGRHVGQCGRQHGCRVDRETCRDAGNRPRIAAVANTRDRVTRDWGLRSNWGPAGREDLSVHPVPVGGKLESPVRSVGRRREVTGEKLPADADADRAAEPEQQLERYGMHGDRIRCLAILRQDVAPAVLRPSSRAIQGIRVAGDLGRQDAAANPARPLLAR